MRKELFFLASILFITCSVFSQVETVQRPSQANVARVLKYHKVLIPADAAMRRKLLELGITIDHSHMQGGSIETEISESEVKMLGDNSIPYKLLIYDMAGFYEARAVSASALKPASPGGCYLDVPVPSHFHLGSMGGFFTLQEMENILDSMALLYPNLVKAKQPISTTQSYEGRNIWYVKLSDNPNLDENESEVLYTALHHAREPQSLSQLIFYMWYLLEHYATDPDIKETLDNTELFFVPCVNPDGYNYNQTAYPNGGGLWRKNRRLNSDNTYGVDLNRNYGIHWGFDNIGSSPNPGAETYRGTAPFSEPETQAIQNFCNSRQFKNALNAHTYGNVLIYPWGHLSNAYTPDSATFVHWSNLLTRDSRFVYGTTNQTLYYTTNGDSDDWMYGEQTSKPMILAMTPEAGSSGDGFWPQPGRITDLCKSTFSQNYNLARLAGSYAKSYDNHDKFVSGNGYLKYKLRRYGLTGGTYTVNIIPVGAGITSVGAQKIHSLLINQEVRDSISFHMSVGLTAGQQVKYLISVNDGVVVRNDTATKIYGVPLTLFFNDGNISLNNMDTTGRWYTDTSNYVSPPFCITDSPLSNYEPGDHKTLSTKGQLSLHNAIYAHLQYYIKFSIEKSYDKGTVEISTDNGITYSPLCGKYESQPSSFGGTEPVYDGMQDEWVKEDIDLSAYLEQNVKIRFTLTADFYQEEDGIGLDDILIRKLMENSVGITHIKLLGDLVLSPNPSNGKFNLHNPGHKELAWTVFNAMGQRILRNENLTTTDAVIDLSGYAPGIYFMKIKSGNQETIKKLLLEE